MKAAIVREAGHAPVYGDFAEPVPSADEVRVTVTAAAISHVVKGRASGKHYSSSGQFPFVVGIDGVGRLDDGRRVYFVVPKAPFGSMAEYAVVSPAHCIALPDDIDDITAAAIANPGMSSWAAYTERAKLKAGETVLINGATGTAGRLAVQIAKHLGARKVIATGRNIDALRSLAAIGADVTIPLVENDAALGESFKQQFAEGVDVVIDYLWGRSAERLLIAAAKFGRDAVPLRFVQIGSSSGADITLPSAVLRSSAIELMGSGIGSISVDGLVHAVGKLLRATTPAGLTVAVKPVPLSDVERAWPEDDSARRTVFTMNAVTS
ncbi:MULTISPECIES: quinone oxidoreductase family protein [Rhizobium]|uniref:NADPH:quinone reductase-like Zn-dependent oxidoreductase n=1 Tax=Rhizobium paranaense TaxID=1650438 RepID=A0A7W8XR79_9HYPH|nr:MULTISPECIES: zinc-binding alcohol dehydrogenase family protein [Rhizobium]MBB5574105.1 NADPH:quinone reductase-like Zn-dependent oxidoreductase [Rhizobium paranaense]PST61201.1 alcohol dehydrogenase [Rhizobium sp. SEMIA4064]